MYKIIEAPKRMTHEEILNEFDGQWVFLVQVESRNLTHMDSAIPIIISDEPWGGPEDIYITVKKQYPGCTMHLSLLKNELNVFGFREV